MSDDPENDDPPEQTSGSSSSRMSEEDYDSACDLYERGDLSISELSDKFSVSRQALYKRFKSGGIVKGSKATLAEVKKVVDRFADLRGDFIEETRIQGYQALRQVQLLARKTVLDQAKRASLPGSTDRIGDVDDDMKTLGRLNKILVDNIAASLGVLRADDHVDSDDLPSLSIEDLTDQDVLDHHISTGALDENATIEDLNLENIDPDDD